MRVAPPRTRAAGHGSLSVSSKNVAWAGVMPGRDTVWCEQSATIRKMFITANTLERFHRGEVIDPVAV